MLLLLTAIYCGFVWLVFYKFRWLEFTKPRKTGVVVLGIAGLLYLVIALGRYMPSISDNASVMNASVEIRADVGGRVTKVWVTTASAVKKGDPLFQVDPSTYEHEVRRAEAALRQAEQDVRGLRAALDEALAAVGQAKAAIQTAQASRDNARDGSRTVRSRIAAAREDLTAATAAAEQTSNTLLATTAQANMLREAAKKNAISKFDLEEAEKTVAAIEALLKGDRARERKARIQLEETLPSELAGAQSRERQAEAQVRQAEESLVQVEAAARRARVAAESTIDGEHTLVRQAKEGLALAKWDLDHTRVEAPDDGWIYNPQVRVGTYVRIMDRVMSFVSVGDQWIIAPVGQFSAALIEPGDDVDLTFRMYPGRIFQSEVESVAFATGESQPVVSGQLPTAAAFSPASTYLIRIRTVDSDPDRPLYPGMAGTAAVYTSYGKPIHIIRQVIIRMEAWLNFLPF